METHMWKTWSGCGQFPDQFTQFQIEGLKSHIQVHSKYIENKLRKCTHATIQSPRVWKKLQDANFWKPTAAAELSENLGVDLFTYCWKHDTGHWQGEQTLKHNNGIANLITAPRILQITSELCTTMFVMKLATMRTATPTSRWTTTCCVILWYDIML